MNRSDVVNHRMMKQGLAGTPFKTADDVVRSLLGVQSQDYFGARWAVGQRVAGATDASIHAAFNEGRILRTHVLRPTWHFVTSDDIRWMLELTAPRVRVLNGPYYRSSGLDAETLVRSKKVIVTELMKHTVRTRPELANALAAAGLPASGLSLTYAVMDAELECLICSGPVRGKQHTYALLAERAPQARILSPDDALAEMTVRFFSGHGPVSLRDYVRWSGLTVADARRGLEMVKDQLQREDVDGVTVWFGELPAGSTFEPRPGYLLSEYDECYLTYRDVQFDDWPPVNSSTSFEGYFYRPVILHGKRAATWRRTISTRSVVVDVHNISKLDARLTDALDAAVNDLGTFLGLPIRWQTIAG